MARDVYLTVRQCHSWLQEFSHTKHQWKLQLFSASRPLAFVAMDIMRPVPERCDGNSFVIFIIIYIQSWKERFRLQKRLVHKLLPYSFSTGSYLTSIILFADRHQIAVCTKIQRYVLPLYSKNWQQLHFAPRHTSVLNVITGRSWGDSEIQWGSTSAIGTPMQIRKRPYTISKRTTGQDFLLLL